MKKSIIFVLLIALIFLYGCGNTSPKGSIDNLLASVKKCEIDKIIDCVKDGQNIADIYNNTPDYLKDLFSKGLGHLQYKILDIEEKKEGKAIAKIEVNYTSYVDAMHSAIGDYLVQYGEKLINEENILKGDKSIEFEELLNLYVSKLGEKSDTLTVSTYMEKKNDKWVITDNNEFIEEILFGNTQLLLESFFVGENTIFTSTNWNTLHKLDTIESDGISYVFLNYEELNTYNGSSAQDGEKYVIFNIKITNNSGGDFKPAPHNMLIMNEGLSPCYVNCDYEVDGQSSSELNHDLSDFVIIDGETKDCKFVFLVNDKDARLSIEMTKQDSDTIIVFTNK